MVALSISVTTVQGEGVTALLPELARLRITVFREFPYLYDGDAAYEETYLATYARCPRAVVVVARDGDRVVGASTGLPLVDETEEVQRPFHEHGYDPAHVFYFGESVLETAYRGQGIGGKFFDLREAHAMALGGFRWTTFCAVQRPEGHPRRPADYVPLNDFWVRRGYEKHPLLHTTFVWKDLDETVASEKPMGYWLKGLMA